LYEMLIKPFEMPSATRIIISPDGGFLPFEALSSSPASPEYLVRKYAFSYTYSAGFLSKSVRNKGLNIFSRPFLGLAPVQFAPWLSQASLPGSDQVLKTIDQQFFRSKTLSGPAASRNAFLKEFSNYRIVQLLTHATADSSGAVPTLYFADSTLSLNELSVVGMPSTELLVLSACQTGIGKNQRGEGVLSLARGFAGLGIPSTLTTLWRVENESVYTLTELFYQALERKQPLDLALQTAKKNWLQTAGPSGRLPYAWAGMVLVGKVAPVNLGPSRPIVFVLFGGLVVLLVFLFYSSRSRKA
jgi:CHAT domain-containing protein